jgi:hypothetical protein
MLGLSFPYEYPYEGWLKKRGHVFKTWRLRYFSFDKETNSLAYFKDETKTDMKGMYVVNSNSTVYQITPDQKSPESVFVLNAKSNGEPNTLLMSGSEEDVRRWLLVLRFCIYGEGYGVIIPPSYGIHTDYFENTMPLQIMYRHDNVSIRAHDMCILRAETTFAMPTFQFQPNPAEYFVLIMTNIGPKNSTGITYREFIHYLAVNISVENEKTQIGNEILSYLPARPCKDTGLNRYVFLLFRQSFKLSKDKVTGNDIYAINFCDDLTLINHFS